MRAIRIPIPVAVYWVIVVALLAVGLVSILSIGVVFLVAGLAMAAAGPMGWRPAVLRPIPAAAAAFLVGYWLLAPLQCHGLVHPATGLRFTSCFSLVGIEYSGTGTYDPSHLPAVLGGVGLAALVAAGVAWGVRRRASGKEARS
ncbi:MAG: hypothetical protein HY658_10110 [Actinobacteria bacterium]|nr:hypothetical protein [Actinomycetota bacterium]